MTDRPIPKPKEDAPCAHTNQFKVPNGHVCEDCGAVWQVFVCGRGLWRPTRRR